VPIYGWFSAGFDTLDLKQTKALVDELTERGRLWSKRLSVQGVPSMKAELSRVVATEPSHAWKVRFWQMIAKAFRAAKRATLIGHLGHPIRRSGFCNSIGTMVDYEGSRPDGRTCAKPRCGSDGASNAQIDRGEVCASLPISLDRPVSRRWLLVPIHPGIDEMRQMWKLVRVGDPTLKADCDGYQKKFSFYSRRFHGRTEMIPRSRSHPKPPIPP
jgi:hypothetical protein